MVNDPVHYLKSSAEHLNTCVETLKRIGADPWLKELLHAMTDLTKAVTMIQAQREGVKLG